MRKQSLLQPGQKHHVELQPLGAVDGKKRHAGVRIELVEFGGERGPVQKLEYRFAPFFGLIGGAHQFIDIGDPILRFLCGFPLFEHLAIADLVDDFLQQSAGRDVGSLA